MNKKMIVRLGVGVFAALSAGIVCAALPQVSNVNVTRLTKGRVAVTYDLDSEAVVTFDVTTNGVSVGAANLVSVNGDVFKRLPAGQGYRIVWNARDDWAGKTEIGKDWDFKVIAWALTDKPDYLVVDLNAPKADCARYYPSVEWLPGGLLENPAYRTSSIVMKRVHAKGFPWVMGDTVDGGSAPTGPNHVVTLPHDYYMGVFEVTQSCWTNVYGAFTPKGTPKVTAKFTVDGDMRPFEFYCSYYLIRENTDNATANELYEYPNPPCPDSFLGKLRDRTGIDFDLPGEAEWEFAANAGVPPVTFNTGVRADSVDAALTPGRCTANGGSNNDASAAPDEGGTARVGSYAPSLWGFYDFHGNVMEWCLDWYAADISDLNGAVNAKGRCLADGETAGAQRICRGNAFNKAGGTTQRVNQRSRGEPKKSDQAIGFRLCCHDGLD